MTRGRRPRRSSDERSGFSLVELIVALTILSVGALAMAGTTVSAVRSVTISDLSMERTVTCQRTIERILALPFDSVASGSDSLGEFRTEWNVTDLGQWKSVRIVLEGPGRMAQAHAAPVGVIGEVADTLFFTVLKP